MYDTFIEQHACLWQKQHHVIKLEKSIYIKTKATIVPNNNKNRCCCGCCFFRLSKFVDDFALKSQLQSTFLLYYSTTMLNGETSSSKINSNKDNNWMHGQRRMNRLNAESRTAKIVSKIYTFSTFQYQQWTMAMMLYHTYEKIITVNPLCVCVECAHGVWFDFMKIIIRFFKCSSNIWMWWWCDVEQERIIK